MLLHCLLFVNFVFITEEPLDIAETCGISESAARAVRAAAALALEDQGVKAQKIAAKKAPATKRRGLSPGSAAALADEAFAAEYGGE